MDEEKPLGLHNPPALPAAGETPGVENASWNGKKMTTWVDKRWD